MPDSKTKARLLTEQFKSVFTPSDNSPPPELNGKPYDSITEIIVDQCGITKLLKNLDPSKACCPQWHTHCSIRILCRQCSPCHRRHLPKIHQYRNPSHWLAETQPLTTTHDLLTSFDAGKRVNIAIPDFSKAFNKVPHKNLLHKLDHYSVRGPLYTWLTTFLTQQSMKVVLEGESSDEVPVESWVPQGAVRSPILFSVTSMTFLPVWHPRSGSLPMVVLSTEKSISSMAT